MNTFKEQQYHTWGEIRIADDEALQTGSGTGTAFFRGVLADETEDSSKHAFTCRERAFKGISDKSVRQTQQFILPCS